MLTPDWHDSEWSNFEGLLTQTADPAARRRKLLPVLLRPCKLPSRIAMLTYLDMTEPGMVQRQMPRLIRAMEGRSRRYSHV